MRALRLMARRAILPQFGSREHAMAISTLQLYCRLTVRRPIGDRESAFDDRVRVILPWKPADRWRRKSYGELVPTSGLTARGSCRRGGDWLKGTK